MKSLSRIAPILAVMLIFSFNLVWSQGQLPICAERPTWIDPPWINGLEWCLEEVIHDEAAGELAFTALAAGADGVLYAARPLTGEVFALRDTDGDELPDTAHVVAEGLTMPNGLAYYDGALYISGGRNLYRLIDDDITLLVDDLPWDGSGFWTGGLTIGPDERIYVSIGAPCDFCQPADTARGAIWSYTLDGSDAQQVASGLRQPGDVAFREGMLWTLDSARDGLTEPNLDELNRVSPGANFGWPHCVGQDNRADLPDGDCQQAAPPALSFPTHSNPIGMAVYDHDTFPQIQGDLLVVLFGNSNQAALEGYALAAVSFDEQGQPISYRVIIPEQSDTSFPPGLTLQDLQYQGSGLWPHRPFDVTVSMEGWIYVSLGGGRIFALRPRAG